MAKCVYSVWKRTRTHPVICHRHKNGTRSGRYFPQNGHRSSQAQRPVHTSYGSGASLYIRPLEIGMSAQIGVHPASEYLFMVMVTPVGPTSKKVSDHQHLHHARIDRVAPKAPDAGKWAATMRQALRRANAPTNSATAPFSILTRKKKVCDECGPANFFAIKDGVYITPASESILPR